ncbi:MAG: PQQ-binding-like beta-propeller repeat protein, partial [Bryobacteraceae bacterium]
MHRIKSWMVWLVAAILPPAGLLLLWMKPGLKVKRRVMDSVLMAVWGVAWLTLFFGLRFQLDGSGSRPMFSFYKAEAHYDALERSRAQAAPAPAPDAPKIVEAAPAQAVVAAPAAAPAVAGGRLTGAYWTDFRGPRRDGRYDEMPILTTWPKLGLKMLWQQPVGGGYASFVVANGLAFTIEQRRKQEAVAAYDLRTGREAWVHAWDAEFRESMGGDGPRATPTWHEGRVYALGAEGELRCLDAETGKRIWARNILRDNGAENVQWGMSAAPLIVDDKVIVLPGGSGGKSVAAYNKVT